MTAARPQVQAAPARESDRTGNRPAPVVVGVDGSLNSTVALRWAARQARATGARLLVVRAWQPSFAESAPRWPAPRGAGQRCGDEAGHARAEADSAVRSVLGAGPADVAVDVAVLEGEPGPALVSAARDASLLVVGTRGHGAVARALLGSVSGYCTDHAACTVVVVPTPAAAAAERLYPVAAPPARPDCRAIPAQSRVAADEATPAPVPAADRKRARGWGNP